MATELFNNYGFIATRNGLGKQETKENNNDPIVVAISSNGNSSVTLTRNQWNDLKNAIDQGFDEFPEPDNTIYIDIPTQKMIGNPEGAWENVATAKTKKQAIEWIRENIGYCDDDGNICLLSNVPN